MKEFIAFIEEKGFLAREEDERLQMMQQRYERNMAWFSTSLILLAICPTLSCNFGCPYCYEKSQNDSKVMNDDTLNAPVSFIKSHKEARSLSVSWYGGEPALAFGVIKNLRVCSFSCPIH